MERVAKCSRLWEQIDLSWCESRIEYEAEQHTGRSWRERHADEDPGEPELGGTCSVDEALNAPTLDQLMNVVPAMCNTSPTLAPCVISDLMGLEGGKLALLWHNSDSLQKYIDACLERIGPPFALVSEGPSASCIVKGHPQPRLQILAHQSIL